MGTEAESVAVYLFMGICGTGKSTLARRFARARGIEMIEADDFHSSQSIAKMAGGTPLEDGDRAEWLRRLNAVLREKISNGESVVLACSALKQSYREALARGLSRCQWIYLKGSRELILERTAARRNHFMPAGLVDSQLAILEEPEDALEVDIAKSPEEILEELLRELGEC